MRWNPFNHKIGLALGGGGAKGLAHIGVLQALHEEGVEISYLSGTSVGAIVASYFAFGIRTEKLQSLVDRLNINEVFSFSLNKMGFLKTESIRELLLEDIGDVKIEDSEIPLAICTTDIRTGESVIFTEGSLCDAVCASVAIPGVFIPVKIGNRILVDGGLSQNVPVEVLDQMGAGILVGVDLNRLEQYPEVENLFDVMGNAIDIAIDSKTREQMKKADFAISLNLKEYSRFDNSDSKDELVSLGYEEAKRQLFKLVWLKRLSGIHYLKTMISNLSPLKWPNIFPDLLKTKLKGIKHESQE